MIRVTIRFSVWSVSGYAHVRICTSLFSIVIDTLPRSPRTKQVNFQNTVKRPIRDFTDNVQSEFTLALLKYG